MEPIKKNLVFTKRIFNRILREMDPLNAFYIKHTYKFNETIVLITVGRRPREVVSAWESRIRSGLELDGAKNIYPRTMITLPVQDSLLISRGGNHKKPSGLDVARELEKGLVAFLVEREELPGDVRYNGSRVQKFVQESAPSIDSTPGKSFGFLYFVRNGDLYKVGITENLLRRLGELSPDEVLNVVRCINFKDLEKEIHSCFKKERLPQTEYFRLDEYQIKQVHNMFAKKALLYI